MTRLYLLLVALCFISSCGLKAPGVKPAFVNPSVDHDRFTGPCADCHEDLRPAPDSNIAHGFSNDCSGCHSFNATTLWRPSLNPGIAHNPPPTSCSGCHGTKRPSTDTHPQTGDCVSCHRYPSWDPL